jgi:predicted adenylyl cyclase CyaB
MKLFEVEQKYRVKEPKAIRALLRDLGAKKIAGGVETNEFFDRDGDLGKRRVAMRLRQFGKKAVLTLKGPRLKSRFTKRMEIETQVDLRPLKTILQLSGFKVVRRYEKQRELYRLGKSLITLDHLKRFGWFLEIEGTAAAIAGLEKRLGLSARDREQRSYLHMLFGWRH